MLTHRIRCRCYRIVLRCAVLPEAFRCARAQLAQRLCHSCRVAECSLQRIFGWWYYRSSHQRLGRGPLRPQDCNAGCHHCPYCFHLHLRKSSEASRPFSAAHIRFSPTLLLCWSSPRSSAVFPGVSSKRKRLHRSRLTIDLRRPMPPRCAQSSSVDTLLPTSTFAGDAVSSSRRAWSRLPSTSTPTGRGVCHSSSSGCG